MLTTEAEHKTYLPRRNSTPGVLFFMGICTFMMIAFIQTARELHRSNAGQALPLLPYLFGAMTIFPFVFALRCLYLLRRTATFVQMEQEILRLRGPLLRKSIPWNRIARIRVKNPSLLVLDHCENVVLYNSAGKKLGLIRNIFDNFPQLLREIEIRSSASRGEPTTNSDKDTSDAHAVMRRRHMTSAFVFVALAALMIPLAAFVLNWRLAEESLPTKGRSIDADITRHWFIADSFWLDYQFTVDGRQYQREVRMDRTPWNDLTHSKTVPVLYAPSHPWINRPLVGEQPIKYPNIFPFMVGFIGFCLVMSLVSLLRYFLVGRTLFAKPMRLRRL